MHSVVQRLVEVLEDDARQWDEAARQCDFIIPYLAGKEQKQQWRNIAKSYRERARGHRAIIELVKVQEEEK